MKRLLMLSAAAALMSAGAYAADLPVYEPPPAMVAPEPVASNWTGFYIGLHGGYGWGNLNDNDASDDVFDNADVQGAVIGGQLGVNWQWNNFVLGVEGDAGWSGIDTTDEFDDNAANGEDMGFDYLASVRGRLGLGFDRFMIYGTGGVGFTSFSTDGIADSGEDTQIGWVAGGGAELLVTDNVSLGAEYLHYEFDDTFDDGDTNVGTSADVIRGRVNVKFDSLFGG